MEENKKDLPQDVAQIKSNDELEQVSGGFIFGEGNAKGRRWEVIDDNSGEVLGRYETKEEARKMASKKRQSTTRIYWDGDAGLKELRNENQNKKKWWEFWK